MINEWWFGLSAILVAMVAWGFIAFPLAKKAKIFSLPLTLMILLLLYWQWGSFGSWHQYEQQLRQLKQIKNEWVRYKSSNELIEQFKLKLKEKPTEPKGWYLLGRLYSTEARWPEARDAFAKSLSLKPKDEAAMINYILSLWEINHRKFDLKIKGLLTKVLADNPNQPDALILAAKEAFEDHDNKTAILYWKRLLAQVSPDSKQAQFLRKAIAKASE